MQKPFVQNEWENVVLDLGPCDQILTVDDECIFVVRDGNGLPNAGHRTAIAVHSSRTNCLLGLQSRKRDVTVQDEWNVLTLARFMEAVLMKRSLRPRRSTPQ